jgi:hypothetical protein
MLRPGIDHVSASLRRDAPENATTWSRRRFLRPRGLVADYDSAAAIEQQGPAGESELRMTAIHSGTRLEADLAVPGARTACMRGPGRLGSCSDPLGVREAV